MEEANKSVKAGISKRIVMLIAGAFASVSVASADIAADITNITTIMTAITAWFNTMLSVFMTWPLSLFVTLGIFITFLGLVAGLLIRRGRRR